LFEEGWRGLLRKDTLAPSVFVSARTGLSSTSPCCPGNPSRVMRFLLLPEPQRVLHAVKARPADVELVVPVRPLQRSLYDNQYTDGESASRSLLPSFPPSLLPRARSNPNQTLRERGLTPRAAIHWTLLLRGFGVDPLQKTVHMKDVGTLAPDCKRKEKGRRADHASNRIQDLLSGHSSPGVLQSGQHPS
jgi:hypothetical protein